MAVPFSPRAALCTAVVLCGFAAFASAELPVGLLGWEPMAREGRAALTRGGSARPQDEREIVGAVLLYEARREGRQNVCLKLAPEGTALEEEKGRIRTLQRQLKEEPRARERIAGELDRLRNPERRWLLPSGRIGSEAPITPDSAQPLRTAETALLGAAPAGPVDLTLNVSDYPAFQAPDSACNPLFFTAPAVAGEIAFVETAYDCGPGCAEGWMYAVVRREDRWEVGALAKT